MCLQVKIGTMESSYSNLKDGAGVQGSGYCGLRLEMQRSLGANTDLTV